MLAPARYGEFPPPSSALPCPREHPAAAVSLAVAVAALLLVFAGASADLICGQSMRLRAAEVAASAGVAVGPPSLAGSVASRVSSAQSSIVGERYAMGKAPEPGLLPPEPPSRRAARAAAILRGLWAGTLPAGVRRAQEASLLAAVAAASPPPLSLRRAVRGGPDAVRRAVLGAAAAELPEGTVAWGRGGAPAAWPEPEASAFLQRLFRRAEGLGLAIRLTAQDLFHGHVFALPPAPGGAGELGVLFHAKEYPEDGPRGEGSGFNSSDPECAHRNLLYLASTNGMYVIDPSGENRVLLRPSQGRAAERPRTVDEAAFAELAGVAATDVNFLPWHLGEPAGAWALFAAPSRPVAQPARSA